MIKKDLLQQQHHKKIDISPKKQKRQIQSIDLPHKQQSKKNKENVVIQEYNKMRLLEKKKESGKIKKIQFEDDADISEEEIITTSLVKSPKKRKSHGTDKKSTKSAEFSLITEENIKLYNLEQDNKILQQSKQKKKTVRKHKKQVVKCKYGILCRNIKTPNGCKYHHIPCKKGKNCIFHLHGTCSFYHPK
jgi:hypothetical protein